MSDVEQETWCQWPVKFEHNLAMEFEPCQSDTFQIYS